MLAPDIFKINSEEYKTFVYNHSIASLARNQLRAIFSDNILR